MNAPVKTPVDGEIAAMLTKLNAADHDAMSAPDIRIHVRALTGLLAKINRRHDELIKLRDEVELRTQNAMALAAAADLGTVLKELHDDLRPACPPPVKNRWWRRG